MKYKIQRNLGYLLWLPVIILLFLFFFDKSVKVEKDARIRKIKVQYKSLKKPEDIQPVKDSSVVPYLYKQSVSLEGLRVEKKKQKFIDMMLPAILVAKFRINEARKKVQSILEEKRAEKKAISKEDSLFLVKMQKNYKADEPQDLIPKMQTHPVSIVLAQAALECGWGTSRFFVQGNNVFGVWSYDKNEPRLKASFSRGNKSVYVRKYSNLAQSIEDYFKTIARVPVYHDFREQRMKTSDPFKLLPYLKHYSELREIYIKRLENVIKMNNFTKYDDYFIDEKYIVPPKKSTFS